MPAPDVLAIHAVPHPELPVRQAGFPLDHAYVEHCWSAVIGPTCTLLLRRLPILWCESEPVVVRASELSRSLGLGADTNRDRKFWRTITRLTQYGLARPAQDNVLDVYATVRPLTPRQVARLPEWSQQAHHRLLGEHLDQLAAGSDHAATPQSRITTRLDRLERQPGLSSGLGR